MTSENPSDAPRRPLSAQLGDYILYGGELMQVTAICTDKLLTLDPVADPHIGAGDICPGCGSVMGRVEIVEDCLTYRENAKPVPTIAAGEE